MISLAIPNIGDAEGRYLQSCIDDNFVSSVGPFVTRFETMVAAATGAPGAVATSAGTTGLHVALHALGVGHGDVVICPSFTFIASANAISHCGATPWLFDIDADWLLDLDQVERVLEAETQRDGDRLIRVADGARVAAILPVYTLGNIPDLDRLKALGERFGLPVVADAAAALGATRAGRTFGDAVDLSVISFNGNKVVTAGGGGAVVGPAVERLKRIRHLTATARVSADYSHDEVGFNYRMTNLQAAVGCGQMERLDAFVERKRAIRERYAEAFADLPGQTPFPLVDGGSAWFSGMALEREVWPRVATLVTALAERGVEARPFWKPVHLQTPYAKAMCADLGRSIDVWDRILTLPCSTGLSEADQDRVIDAVRAMAPS